MTGSLPISSLVSPPEAPPLNSFNNPSASTMNNASSTSTSTSTSASTNTNTTPVASSNPPQPAPPPPSRPRLPSIRYQLLPVVSAERTKPGKMEQPLSPPVTPEQKHRARIATGPSSSKKPSNATASSSRDPVLFPPTKRAFDTEPLFAPEEAREAEALVDRHIAKKRATGRAISHTPTRAEYMLALSCVSRVATLYNRNPGAWAMKEREILERQLILMNPDAHSHLKKLAPAPGNKRSHHATGAGGNRVQKTPRAKRTTRSPLSNTNANNRSRIPREQPGTSSASPARTTPRPPRVIGTNRDDTNWASLPDYSPPLNTLRGSRGLKADWKGQMLDLTNDPDRNALDPAEITLAATLRLSCATYLCSKRRIFEARLNALQRGKEFRKTDAQQACKIDVNKASKLWTAYERVGWFDPDHFRQFL